MENTPQEAVLKTLMLMGKPERNIKIMCEIVETKDKNGKSIRNMFRTEITKSKDCDLILARSALDFESMDEYMITVVINTLTAFVNTARIKAKVRVIVQDKNDNEPEFFFNESYNKLVPSKYLAEVTSDTEVGTKVLQVIATDKDSGDYGKLKFEISPDTDKSTRKYFEIDPDNGLIVTKSDFKDTSEDDLPFRVIISVRDNPMNSEDSKMKKQS